MQLQLTTSPLFGDPRLPARFWEKVRIGSIPAHRPDLGPCWEWTAARRQGYGYFAWKGTMKRAHRIAYEMFVGPIPEGLVSDHLCRNHSCVCPVHIEPVTHQMNVLRGNTPTVNRARQSAKTHCPRGHSYSGENLRLNTAGGRVCRTCKRAWDREHQHLRAEPAVREAERVVRSRR